MYQTTEFKAITTNEDRLISLEEIAGMCGVSKRTAEAWKYRGVLPPAIEITCRVYGWRLSAINAWLQQHTTHAV